MSDKERKSRPRKGARGEASERERRERQAAQLRANLLRRKEQSRSRAQEGGPAGNADEKPPRG